MKRHYYLSIISLLIVSSLSLSAFPASPQQLSLSPAKPDTNVKDSSFQAAKKNTLSSKSISIGKSNFFKSENKLPGKTGGYDWKIILAVFSVMLTIIFYFREAKHKAKIKKMELEQKYKLEQQELNFQNKLETQKKEIEEKFELKMAIPRASQEGEKEKARLQAEIDVKKANEEKKREQANLSAKEVYSNLLKEELGYINLIGHQDFESRSLSLEDTFVSLRISSYWRSDERNPETPSPERYDDQKDLKPQKLMSHAFAGNNRLLLIVGDPGSGKTTVMKYYALNCLDDQKRPLLGFKEAVFPIFFPLRDLSLDEKNADCLITNLSNWAGCCSDKITESSIKEWIHDRPTLILLDGLDEISDPKVRQAACEVIEKFLSGHQKARVVVTSRWAGYGKWVNVSFGYPHIRADVRDFSFDQQCEFLNNWFYALEKEKQFPGQSVCEEEKEKLRAESTPQSQAVINELKKEENKTVCKLVEVPLLLQILAFLWERRGYFPSSRSDLYKATMSYVLRDREEKEKKSLPPLSANDSQRVLKPVALYMQEDLQQDFIERSELEKQLNLQLKTFSNLDSQGNFCEEFCDYLFERAGLFNRYRGSAYIFRHRSFMEYLSSLQLKDVWHKDGRMKKICGYVYNKDWWEETLRFFMNEATPEMFDEFMKAFFSDGRSKELKATEKGFLLQLIKDAPQKKITALVYSLNRSKVSSKIYTLIDCLKAVDSKDSYEALRKFAECQKGSASTINHAVGVIKGSRFASQIEISEPESSVASEKGFVFSFRNNLEYSAEYIFIPGGNYRYSAREKEEKVKGVYFAKHPVTNKQYNRFIGYLSGDEAEFQKVLSWKEYAKELDSFAKKDSDFFEYLKKGSDNLAQYFRSWSGKEKHFNGADQPVTGITWYKARAYCFWLSLLTLARNNKDLKLAPDLYNLPLDVEWEWAASGREPDGSLREYPWPKDKGKPNEKLANYNGNVGATTPVGGYPEGATPEGLMDMAGNVFEWCGRDSGSCSLRGGSWLNYVNFLRCSARFECSPDGDYDFFGFRVVCPQSDLL